MPQAKQIPLAQAGQINDRALSEVAEIANGVAHGRAITAAEGEFLLMVAGPAMEELLHRRRAMSVISDMADLDNVVFLPGAE